MQNLRLKISQSNIILICIILLLGFLTHAGMLTAPFKTLDDNTSIVNNADIRSFANVGRVFTASFFGGGHYYRPMVALSFMTEYRFFGLDPFFYNLTNLLLHLVVAALVYFLIRALMDCRRTAFFVSLLFAVHPVHWEAVSNIPGRAIILCTLFSFAAFLYFVYALQRKPFFLFYLLSLAAFTCGLLSKESAAVMPILLISYMFFMRKKDERNYALVLPYFVIIGAYVILRKSLGVMETYPWRTLHEHTFGILTFLSAIFTFLRVLIWPTGLHFDRAQAMFLKWSDTGLIESLIALAAIGFFIFYYRKRLPSYVFFFLSWFFIELFPVSQVVTTIGVGPGYISAAEHFLYSPSVGIFVLMAASVKYLYDLNRKRSFISLNAFRSIIMCVFLALILVTFYQEIYARSSIAMFRRTLDYNPNNARINFSMGIELVNRKRFAEAEPYFKKAVDLEPRNMKYRVSLGRALFDQGKILGAIGVYESIGRTTGKLKEMVQRNLAEAYKAAEMKYSDRIAREPENAQVHYSLGTVYFRSRRIEKAVEQFQRAVALNPGYRLALFNLASSFGLLGEDDQAVENYQRVLALDPSDGLAVIVYKQMSEIYARQGNAVLADEYRRKADTLWKSL